MWVYEMQRMALEQMYTGICSVYEYQNVEDQGTKVTSKQEVEVLSGQPCHKSHSGIYTTDTSTGAAKADISVKLFLAPEIRIKPGSKIAVEQDGLLEYYASSGKPAVYPTHQEIMLAPFKRWN